MSKDRIIPLLTLINAVASLKVVKQIIPLYYLYGFQTFEDLFLTIVFLIYCNAMLEKVRMNLKDN